jgi:hypothetical protein
MAVIFHLAKRHILNKSFQDLFKMTDGWSGGASGGAVHALGPVR